MAQVFKSNGQLLGWLHQHVDPGADVFSLPKREKGDKGTIREENKDVVHQFDVKMYGGDGPFLVSDDVPDWFWSHPDVVKFDNPWVQVP